MIPLIIVLPIALWKRISLFGVTEGRYLGVLIGLWLALITIYFLFSRSKNIMVIPASLAVLALGMSFGPWSMFAISEKDQIARLEEILIRNKVLVDGHVQKAQAEVPFEDTKQISSILVYLDAVHGYRKIEQWFSDSLYSESNQSFPLAKSPSEVAKLMGIKFVQMWMNPDGHASVLSIDLEKSLSVEGYNRMIRAQYIITGRSESKFPDDHVRYQIGTSFDTLALFFERDGKDVDSICAPLRPVVDRVLAEYGNINPVNVDPEKMTAVASTATMKMKIYLRRVQLKRSEGGIVPESYSLDLLYSILPTVATKNQKK
jgi:hypothetical protein